MRDDKTTHFGYTQVPEGEKAGRVGEVFRSVAPSYDVMNDLMSLGLHRAWKRFAIEASGVREGSRVLDVASGSGDLAAAFARRAGPTGSVWMTDINAAMLKVGRDKLIDAGVFAPLALCDAEKLPFPSDSFDCVSVAFGLRNMTHKDRALAEMTRVARPGGRVIVLEFSRPWKPLQRAYDAYSFNVLPFLGRHVARDEAAYRYLAESIRMHPDQETLKAMMEAAGLARVEYFNLAAGVVALHRGFKT
ncbi:MAG TPA: bifunctional demethylmenaquinone methyltransferase/2-methoxy-6-polyprenyl-1,4-benzoquinol methylase UbiE [Usitatibacter sp.]|nr:bifunctional demethylmenaquinone methyltransferase/2-methoxy-6-polyprenyl-1,4-benzoquinol methylase UbiE [Usitatibacter sp.]HST00903.1 bifunctional demethylmenaquinone methyltransferase/2-methoxy-6-polyprenyl-1,4-benzoquinol methylase UbiE [Usitatibacter sp.]